MPTCKMYFTNGVSLNKEQLLKMEEVILDGLEAKGERAEVISIDSNNNNLDNIYVEIICRNKPNRTPTKMERLAERIQHELNKLLNLSEAIRVRIIKIDEDHLTAIN